MNQLTVQQRKMVYAAAAVLLIIPIIIFGGPAGETEGSGGVLAKMRHDYELGESSLGNVDPTSSAVSLVLLGFRGVAASVLWQQADHYKNTKNFSQLEETVESIILLQPHFKTVWENQAWNLAYNVSAECDAVEDRYHWLKRGAKFLMRGIERNQKVPELCFVEGELLGTKLGRADERVPYREFFLRDPDEETWKGKQDEIINPEGEDNYLVAKKWYQRANDLVQAGYEQHRMDLGLFLAYPYRSLMDYAVARQDEGIDEDLDSLDVEERKDAYDSWAEVTRKAWERAYDEWTTLYGTMEFMSAGFGVLVLEPNEAKLRELAEREGVTYEQKQHWQDRYHKTTHYLYWKKRCEIEKRETMMRARYEIAEGRRLRDNSNFDEAKLFLESGMSKLAEVIAQYDRPNGTNALLDDEAELVEDGFKAILVWQQVLEFLGEEKPEDFPLKKMWEAPQFSALKKDLTERFQKVYGTGGL